MKKTYRIALYGLSRAGKSCVLAALSLPKTAHPKGYTSTFVPVDVPLPKKPRPWTPRTELSRLHRGATWIRESHYLLDEGGLPRPTLQERHPPIFRYKFGTPRREFMIEFIDYAGGTIDPEIAAEKIATDLRKRIARMDGILVLMEAPNDGAELRDASGEAFKAMNNLAQAFVSISEERSKGRKSTSPGLDLPLALLVNKWDRMGNNLVDYGNIQTTNAKLRELFRNQKAPHRSLYDALKALVKKGDFSVFPVSALGACETIVENGDARPRPIRSNPWKPFYLLEPFVWISDKRDEIDLGAIRDQSVKLRKWWRFFIPWIPHRPYQLMKLGNRLFSRLPDGELELKKEIRKIINLAKLLFVTRIFIIGIFLANVYCITELGFHHGAYRQVKTVYESTGQSKSDLQVAITWLENYINEPWWKDRGIWLFFRTDKAQEWNNKLFEQLDKMWWSPVDKAPTVPEKAKRAREYVKEMARGTHLLEAQARIDEYEKKKAEAEAEQEVFELLRNGKFREARTKAEAWFSDPESLPVSIYKKNVLQRVEAKLKSLGITRIDDSHPISAIEELFEDCQQTRKEFLPPEGLDKCRELKNQYWDSIDQYLYEDMRAHPEVKSKIDKYIGSPTPRKYGLREAEQLRDWLNERQGPLQLSLVVDAIRWDYSKTGSNNEIRLLKNGRTVTSTTGVPSQSGTTTNLNPPLKSPRFPARLDDEARLGIEIVYHSGWTSRIIDFDKLQAGGKSVNVHLKELVKGYSLQLEGEECLKCTAILHIAGVKPVPELKAWSKD